MGQYQSHNYSESGKKDVHTLTIIAQRRIWTLWSKKASLPSTRLYLSASKAACVDLPQPRGPMRTTRGVCGAADRAGWQTKVITVENQSSESIQFIQTIWFTSDKGGGKRFCPSLSVCLSVSKIIKKRVHGFGWNVACQQMSGHGRTD